MAVNQEFNWRSYQRTGFRWAVYELYSATLHAVMLGWGLWMVGADALHGVILAVIVWFLIVSGSGWHKLQQLSLLIFGAGLLIWLHIPAVDHAIAVAQTWQP